MFDRIYVAAKSLCTPQKLIYWLRSEVAAQVAFANTAFQGIALFVISAVVVGSLNPIAQGYYYTFISVLSIQVFIELGIGQCLVQCFSHETAGVMITREGGVHGHNLKRYA